MGDTKKGYFQTLRKEEQPFFHLSDLGNAERFIDTFGADVLYSNEWKHWLVWVGSHYLMDKSQSIFTLARRLARDLYRQAADIESENERKALARHAVKTEAQSKINAMVSLAEMFVPIDPTALDRNPWVLNCANGTVELKTGVLREHRREDYITKLVPSNYDPRASCPRWEAFLEKIIPDPDVVDFLWRALGYSLTGDTSEQVFFLLHGSGQNGKSTFLNIIKTLLGDYGEQADAASFLYKKSDAVRNDLAKLRGARFVSAIEVGEGRRLAEVLVKQITGQDPLTARFLFSEHFTFMPEFKLWIACNHKPVVQAADHAMWRRVRLIPYTVLITEEERDNHLLEKLTAELPGILAWCVRGCVAWQKEGLHAPEAVLAATKAYRDEQDVVGNFLSECCEVGAGWRVNAGDLLTAYQTFAGDKRITHQKMRPQFEERGFVKERDTVTNNVVWRGLRLLISPETSGGYR
jgi:putative DNA primase/helicase